MSKEKLSDSPRFFMTVQKISVPCPKDFDRTVPPELGNF